MEAPRGNPVPGHLTEFYSNATPQQMLIYNPYLTELDLHILSLRSDDDYSPHTWASLQSLLGANSLHLLTRYPSHLRAYLVWSHCVKSEYGSLTNYILARRLHWTPLPVEKEGQPPCFEAKNSTPLADPADYAILKNDWPYGMEPGITHLCVWLKTPLAVKPEDGDLADDARLLVEDFMTREFRKSLSEREKGDKVLWFKNWVALQSVRGVDHVHVLIKDADEEELRKWMN